MQVDSLATDAHMSLKSLLGLPAQLQLLTATSRDDLRPFHGHVTEGFCRISERGGPVG